MNFDFAKIKDMGRRYADKAKQYAEGLSPMEMKVADATNDDKWGPHGSVMAEITSDAFRQEDYKLILGVIARRLHSEPCYWRRIYKSLLLLEYMAKNGPDRMVTELQSNQKVFSRLQTFEYIDSMGKDQGINVRNRAKELWRLVNDSDLMASEREKAAKNRHKYGGMDASGLSSAAGMGFNSGSAAAPPARDSFATIAADSSGGPPAHDDAVEATRKRLDGFSTGDAAVSSDSTASRAVAAAASKKKLSSVQVDSNIASTLARNFAGAAPAAPPARGAGGAAAAPSGGGDLLGDLFDDAPAAPAADAGDDWADFASAGPAPGAAPSASAAAPADDPFGMGSAPAAADPFGMGDWDAFASAPPPAPAPAATGDPFGTIATGPALGAASGARAALPLDMFAEPAAVSQPPLVVAPAQPTSPSKGAPGGMPMGGGAAAVSSKKADPFAGLF